MSGRRGIVESPYARGCRKKGDYVTLAQNIALFAQVGYCERIGVIDNEQGETRALLKNDVSSPHLSLGVRVSCVGAGNHGHEHHGYDGNHHRYHGHHRYEHDGHHGHKHDGHEHHGHDGHHHRYDNRNYRFHRHHHGYDGNHHKHPAT